MGDVNTTENVQRDEEMDLNALLSSSAPSTESEKQEVPVEKEVVKEEHKSPLDLAIERQKTAQKGIIVDSANEEVGPVQLRPNTDTDAFREGFADELSEQEELIKKAQMIYAVRAPQNNGEYAEMITEINAVSVDDEGVIHVPEGAKYIIPKNPEIVAAVQAKAQVSGEEYPNTEDLDKKTETQNDPVDAEKAARKEKKDQLVKILIDKTGLGANIKFDEEETKAIQTSSMIHLVEVENRDLEVVEIERPDDGTPFMQVMDAYKLSVSKAPMTFPASGF